MAESNKAVIFTGYPAHIQSLVGASGPEAVVVSVLDILEPPDGVVGSQDDQ